MDGTKQLTRMPPTGIDSIAGSIPATALLDLAFLQALHAYDRSNISDHVPWFLRWLMRHWQIGCHVIHGGRHWLLLVRRMHMNALAGGALDFGARVELVILPWRRLR